jgi:hypothetical protein
MLSSLKQSKDEILKLLSMLLSQLLSHVPNNALSNYSTVIKKFLSMYSNSFSAYLVLNKLISLTVTTTKHIL